MPLAWIEAQRAESAARHWLRQLAPAHPANEAGAILAREWRAVTGLSTRPFTVPAAALPDFRRALAAARGWNAPANVLVIGSGPGLAGPPAEAALPVVERQLAGVPGLRISRLDLLPEHLAGAPHSLPYGGCEFDLIVSCSLLHHLFDRLPYLRAVRKLTARGGAAVIACEPNARACAHQEPASAALVQEAVLAEWNGRLQERHGFTRALTANELARLLDPATGSLAPRGISWESSFVEAIPDFRLLWIGTAGLPSGLAPDQHPLDGAVFSGAWVRD